MQLTKGAIGNLINRYKAVLKKCHLMNTFGSLAVAGMLVMGGAGMAVAGAAGDVELKGEHTYNSKENPQVNHLMGGWLVNDAATAGDAKGDITLTVNGGEISEIIGGSYAKGLTANGESLLTVKHGDIATSIGDKTTSAEFVVGGSKVAGGDGANLETGKTSLTINDGTFGTEDKAGNYALVMGGNYAKTAGSSKLNATTDGSSVTVNGGTFHASVVGGSVAHNYSGNGSITVTDNGATSVTITGGTFNPSESNLADSNGGINLSAAVIGGGLAYGANTSTVLGSKEAPVTSSVSISGDKTAINGKVVAGSVVANKGGTAIVHGNTTLAMAGGTAHDDLIGGGMVENATKLPEDSISKYNLNITGDSFVTVTGGNALGEVIGGNYVKTSTAGLENSAKVANSSVTIKGGTFAKDTDSSNKAQYIIGGSKTNASGGGNATTLVEGNSSVLIDGDVTIKDGALIGGSQAKAGNGEKPKATAIVKGNSSVTVNEGTLAGVIGGGIAETYYSVTATAESNVEGTSSVTINGGKVTGNLIETGAVASNTRKLSAAIVGGGLANDKGSTATVGSTSVTIAGGKIDGKVVAGGAAVNGGTTTVKGDTLLTMTGGEVSGDLIGGNMLDGSASTASNKIFNNESNVLGNTHISLTGGSIDGEVIGGGYVRNASGTANVEGDTYVTVSAKSGNDTPQAWVQYVIGGGKAMAVSGQTATTNVDGSTHVLVEGGAAINFGTVAGGGLARSQGGTTTANVSNSNVEINGGTLAGVAGGGIAESYGGNATANVGISSMPNVATLVINEGTINKIKYGDTTSTAAVVGGGIAWVKNGVTGSATANISDLDSTGIDDGIVNTVITGGNINGDVYAGGIADGATAFATVGTSNLTIKGGTFTGNIYAGGLSVDGGTVTTYGPSTVTFDGYDGFTGTVDGTLSIPAGAGDTPPTSSLVFKNYNSTFNGIAKKFSYLNVSDGSTLKLQTLSTGTANEGDTGVFNENALKVAGAGNVEAAVVDVVANNGLSVEDGTLTVTGSLKSAEDGDGTDGINVSGNGVLTAANNLLVTNTDGTIAIADGLNKLYLGNGGTLAVTGLDSISTTDMVSYHSALVVSGSTGLIKYEGAAIEVSATDQTGSGNLRGSVAEGTGALLTGTTVEYDSTGNTTTINGGYGAETVLISNAANGEHTINLNGNLTLLGDGEKLITVNEGATLSTVTVATNKALNLGSAAAPSQGGDLGADVELSDGSSLNAVAGDYTVGAVKGMADNQGTVSSSAGGSLVAESIGEGDNARVAAVNASQGSIHSTGVIRTDKLTIDGGVVSSGRTISVLQAVENMNGTLAAASTISLNKGATNAQGQIVTGGNLTLKGDITKAADGTLDIIVDKDIKASGKNIEATNLQARSVEAKAVSVEGGSLLLAKASTVESLKLTNGTQAVIEGLLKLDGADNTLTVGTGDDTVGGTTLSAKHIDLNDGMLLVDPAWGKDSSNVAVETLTSGDVGVGQNSYLALGTADTSWLPGVVTGYTKGVGLSKDGVTAALGVYKGLTIGTGKALLVDGSKMDTATGPALTNAVNAAADNSATFADNSLLVINGADDAIAAGGAAISFEATGTLKVDAGAKLLVTDAVAGQAYTIVGNVNNPGVDLAGWKNNGMTSTTDMVSLGDAVFDGTNNKVTTTASRNDAHTVFPNLSDGMANAVNDLYTGHAGAAGEPRWDYANVDSADMGVRFLSRATDNRFLGMDKNAAAATIESAARIAFAGAVPQMTKMASDAGSNAVVNRLGFANPADGAQAMNAEGKIVDRNTTGFALWIAPLWQSQHGWGMEADNLDYGFNGNLGGVSLGADYTFENAIRAGITFNIGGGYAESSGGDLNSTENRMSFWGLGAYAGWNYENFGLMADVSYTSTWNDLQQDMDSRMGMGDLEADVQASAISAGLRAEYKLETSVLDVIPHIGVRYMSLNTWGFDAESNGGTVLEGDGFHQDIWTFPVGVTFTKDFTLDSGWSFKPSIDFSVIPAAGDIKAKQDVAFTGLPGTYEVETQMMDYLTWQGGVGLELGNDTMSFGVNYTLQAGQHTTGHGVFGSFRYEF
ncbi:hypothetical protein [Desulfovibrio piger]|uniref:hypothetical protein n=2 Tax=Desulfovibrio TaxID=872 RepID=UPI0026F13470|nr:hypothetical protein [Desulfovibrio piger]MCI7617599.1 hypothetical protein [Desulfovibrio piger]